MELEEAKKVLMSLPQYQERGNEEYEAIDTVISELVALQDLVDEQREEIEELQKENEKYSKCKIANQIIDEMNLDDEVKRISKESLDYYRNNIYECSVDILRVLYGELLQENESLKFENKRSKDKIKEKIEEVKSRECDDVFDLQAFMYEQEVIIAELEELLKGE